MRKLIVCFSLVLAASSPLVPKADAALIYRSGEGWSAEDEESGAAEATAADQLRKAESLQAEGDLKKSLGAYRTLLRRWPNSGAAPKAQFKVAELYQELGDSEKAFKAFGVYLSKYPRGDDFDLAVENQFSLASSFLEGERRKVFGVKTFPSMQKATEMFTQILKNAPFSKWAALSQYNIGRALEKQTKWDEAIAAYQKTVDSYPADEISADAQYQIGYIHFQLAKNGSNDQAARNKAREAFEDFILKYPRSEKVAQATENLSSLSSTDVKKTLGVGQFYEKTGNPKAAVIYYEEVLQVAPDSEEAKIAKKQIEHLKTTVGEDALRAGPERAETGAKAKERRRLQAQVDTASRPDYVGPPAPPAPVVPDEVAPEKPSFRTFPDAPEAPLPSGTGGSGDLLTAPLAPLDPNNP
jgi:outer membrane protein assembly factor BamD